MSSSRTDLIEIAMADPRYAVEAYEFLCQALAYTQQVLSTPPRPEDDEAGQIHHVTGQQLCQGIRQLSLEQFGLMAPVVFQCWGVQGSIDFGKMVYHLIDSGLWHRSENDSLDDFVGCFHLEKDFLPDHVDWSTESSA
ncbi:hypothetical protein K2X85_18210 [bacterium]|nr:hypothetical protein [bacterium]